MTDPARHTHGGALAGDAGVLSLPEPGHRAAAAHATERPPAPDPTGATARATDVSVHLPGPVDLLRTAPTSLHAAAMVGRCSRGRMVDRARSPRPGRRSRPRCAARGRPEPTGGCRVRAAPLRRRVETRRRPGVPAPSRPASRPGSPRRRSWSAPPRRRCSSARSRAGAHPPPARAPSRPGCPHRRAGESRRQRERPLGRGWPGDEQRRDEQEHVTGQAGPRRRSGPRPRSGSAPRPAPSASGRVAPAPAPGSPARRRGRAPSAPGRPGRPAGPV